LLRKPRAQYSERGVDQSSGGTIAIGKFKHWPGAKPPELHVVWLWWCAALALARSVRRSRAYLGLQALPLSWLPHPLFCEI